MSQLQPGDVAPNFKAQVTDGSWVELSSLKGKNVVLFFYPEDMTAGCTIEACSLRDDKAKFDDKNTLIFGVSMDDLDKHKQFTEKDNLNYPLIYDEGGKICAAYGVPTEDGRWPKRMSFLIDKEGKIAKVYTTVKVREHSEELQRDIEALPN